MLLNKEALGKIQNIRLDTRNSEFGISLGVVQRISSGTTGDYYGRTAWQGETITWVSGTGGFSQGYTYNDDVGGVIERRGVRFAIDRDIISTLREDNVYIRYLSEDYNIDSIVDLPQSDEVMIDCSRLT